MPCPDCARLRDRCEERAAELLALREQADRPRCLYCDYGAVDLVSVELLQWHIRKACAAHPLYQAEQRAEQVEARLAKATEALGAAANVMQVALGIVRGLEDDPAAVRVAMAKVESGMYEARAALADEAP